MCSSTFTGYLLDCFCDESSARLLRKVQTCGSECGSVKFGRCVTSTQHMRTVSWSCKHYLNQPEPSSWSCCKLLCLMRPPRKNQFDGWLYQVYTVYWSTIQWQMFVRRPCAFVVNQVKPSQAPRAATLQIAHDRNSKTSGSGGGGVSLDLKVGRGTCRVPQTFLKTTTWTPTVGKVMAFRAIVLVGVQERLPHATLELRQGRESRTQRSTGFPSCALL